MNIRKFDELLSEYNDKLNKISKFDISYKISINHAVMIFLEEVNKLDKNILKYFFKNFNKENISKNEVQKDAFYYLILLVIKNTTNTEFFINYFPEYLESKPIAKSSWFFLRWWQMLISWITKPKLTLNNLSVATDMLNALRDIKYRIASTNNNSLDISLEMGSYRGFSFIVEQFLKNKASPLIYTPINENKLLADWDLSYKKTLYIENTSDGIKSYSDIDTLLNYLRYRIRLLFDSDEKEKLLSEFIKLQDFVFKNKFCLFEEKICEIRKFIKNKATPKNAVKLQGIYNLMEGIKQRLKVIGRFDNGETRDKKINYSRSNFNQILNLTVGKIQYYYEFYRVNLDKQYEFFYGNSLHFYEILNELEAIIYSDKTLFFHASDQVFYHAEYETLATTLADLQRIVNKLENYARKMDPQSLEYDVSQLSQFIVGEILNLQTALKKEMLNNASTYNGSSDDVWDTDWDDVSEITEVAVLKQEQELNKNGMCITRTYQSDSGFSDENNTHLEQSTQSTQQPTVTKLWKPPIKAQADHSEISRDVYQRVVMS